MKGVVRPFNTARSCVTQFELYSENATKERYGNFERPGSVVALCTIHCNRF